MPKHLTPVPSSHPPAPSWWSSLDTAGKAFFLIVGVLSVGGGASYTLSSVVTAGELEESQAPQDTKLEELDRDTDLLFQTTVRLSTQMDEVQRAIVDVRKDLRDLDRGRPLQPLPTPTPVAHPTAVPTP